MAGERDHVIRHESFRRASHALPRRARALANELARPAERAAEQTARDGTLAQPVPRRRGELLPRHGLIAQQRLADRCVRAEQRPLGCAARAELHRALRHAPKRRRSALADEPRSGALGQAAHRADPAHRSAEHLGRLRRLADRASPAQFGREERAAKPERLADACHARVGFLERSEVPARLLGRFVAARRACRGHDSSVRERVAREALRDAVAKRLGLPADAFQAVTLGLLRLRLLQRRGRRDRQPGLERAAKVFLIDRVDRARIVAKRDARTLRKRELARRVRRVCLVVGDVVYVPLPVDHLHGQRSSRRSDAGAFRCC